MKAYFKKYILNFKKPSGTSRGVLTTKDTYFIFIEKEDKVGVGETGLFRGLSCDDLPNYEEKLQWVCENISKDLDALLNELKDFPSIKFGLEMAFKSLNSNNKFELFPSEFTNGNDSVNINGLVWMGDKQFMKSQIQTKIEAGFNCIKIKIGAINFNEEIELLKYIRSQFTEKDIEIRVDANGAFSPSEALEKLKELSDYKLHSIEQPIKQGQVYEMASLCESSPLKIALDEELIGVNDLEKKSELIETIKPPYIILKPSLVGGFSGSKEWISIAENNNANWWITSALESNVGLNAISQFTYTLNNSMPQGLGTGGLFTNNFDSPLEVENGRLNYNTNLEWKFNL